MATFGYSPVGTPGTIDQLTENYKIVSKYTLSENGDVTSVSAYVDGLGAGSGGQVMRAIIYSDSAGSPATRMAVSNEGTVTDGQLGAWQAFALPAPASLTAGDYWLGLALGANNNSSRYFYDSVTNNRKYKAETYSATPATPFGTVDGTDSLQVSMYATYTAVTTTTFMPPPRLGRVRGG